MNIILNDAKREIYRSAIYEITNLCPETIARKIPRANIQQAFVFDTVRKLVNKDAKLLCVGSYEDTACESLKKLGYDIVAIDPAINHSLEQFYNTNGHTNKFDLIFSTSVIEHVQDDELFIAQICQLLKPNGYAVLTCDFNNDWKAGQGKPSEDFRLYTKLDLLDRFNTILKSNRCKMYGDINYDEAPDFNYGGFRYTFATYVFSKEK